VIGEESKRKGTDKLTSRRIERIIKAARARKASARGDRHHRPRRAGWWFAGGSIRDGGASPRRARFTSDRIGNYGHVQERQHPPCADVQGCVTRRIMRLGTVKPVPVFRLPTVHDERSGGVRLVIGVFVVEYRSLQSRLSFRRATGEFADCTVQSG
jgi:hypothetical protein